MWVWSPNPNQIYLIFFEPHMTEVMSKLELQSYEAAIDMADIVSVQKKQMHSEPG